MDESVELRVHGDRTAPTLIYLPGIHGDWTLVTSFRLALQGRYCFVEFNYPRTTTWSLADYAQGILKALAEAGISRGWLIAESFGSQVAWALLTAVSVGSAFRAEGIILAGGFVRYPFLPGVAFAGFVVDRLPESGLRMLLWVYVRYAQFRHRQAPETRAMMSEFVRRRLAPGDREALRHRLELIATNDPRSVVRICPVPLWSLTGFWDPIVPWLPVRNWLRRECSALREDRMLYRADHTVLATQPIQAAEVVHAWIAGAAGIQPTD